jgi:hypothetical protein
MGGWGEGGGVGGGAEGFCEKIQQTGPQGKRVEKMKTTSGGKKQYPVHALGNLKIGSYIYLSQYIINGIDNLLTSWTLFL